MNGWFVAMWKIFPINEERKTCKHVILGDIDHLGQNKENFSKYGSTQLHYSLASIEHNVGLSQANNNEFNMMMASISIILSPRIFVDTVMSIANVELPLEHNRSHKVKSIASLQINNKHHLVTTEGLASKWNTGLEQSKKMIKIITQMGICNKWTDKY